MTGRRPVHFLQPANQPEVLQGESEYLSRISHGEKSSLQGVTSRTTHHATTISTAPHFHGTSTCQSLRLVVKVSQCVVLWLRVVWVGLDVQSVDVAATRTPSVSKVWVENSRKREAGAKSGMAVEWHDREVFRDKILR